MIRGRYGNTSGRPYVDAHIRIPRLGIQGSVSFLIDTGADTTVLMQTDATRLSLDYKSLKTTTTSIGIGGESKGYVEPALLVALDDDLLKVYRIKLTIAKPRAALASAPSLLGRDVLNRWRLVLDYANGRVEAEAPDADWQVEAN